MCKRFACPSCEAHDYRPVSACEGELEVECSACGAHYCDHPRAFDLRWLVAYARRLKRDDPEGFEWWMMWLRHRHREAQVNQQEKQRQPEPRESEVGSQRLALLFV